jgi:hypothetical protein
MKVLDFGTSVMNADSSDLRESELLFRNLKLLIPGVDTDRLLMPMEKLSPSLALEALDAAVSYQSQVDEFNNRSKKDDYLRQSTVRGLALLTTETPLFMIDAVMDDMATIAPDYSFEYLHSIVESMIETHRHGKAEFVGTPKGGTDLRTAYSTWRDEWLPKSVAQT